MGTPPHAILASAGILQGVWPSLDDRRDLSRPQVGAMLELASLQNIPSQNPIQWSILASHLPW